MSGIPKAMRVAQALDLAVSIQVPRAFHLLLINQFYPKDPHASSGKNNEYGKDEFSDKITS